MKTSKEIQKIIEKYTLISLGCLFFIPYVIWIIISLKQNYLNLHYLSQLPATEYLIYGVKLILYYLTIWKMSQLIGRKIFNEEKSSFPLIIFGLLCMWSVFQFISFLIETISKSITTDLSFDNLIYNFVMWFIFGVPVILFATLTHGLITGSIIHKKLKKKLIEISSKKMEEDIHNNELTNFIENLEKK